MTSRHEPAAADHGIPRRGHADVLAARQAAFRAAVDLARSSEAEPTTRPAFPGARIGVPDFEPLTGLHASRQVELAAKHAARDYVRLAREEGRSWHEIGQALGLEPGADADQTGATVAESAYTYAAGDLSPRLWPSERSFPWHCHTCDRVISDIGPYFGWAENERGHAEGCERFQAAIADRETDWEALSSQGPAQPEPGPR